MTVGCLGSEVTAPALALQIYTSPTREIGEGTGRTFSPITSTLIVGTTEAVLVDAQFLKDDVEAVGDMVAASGRRLTTIFITHGHGDHFFGAGRLVERFPGTRVVATPGVVAYIKEHLERDVTTWSAMFGEAVVAPTMLPSPLDSDVIAVDDHALRIIEVGQGDIAPTAVLHIPELDAVIAGDVAYNQIHAMLGFSGPDDWKAWIASLDAIERLHPRIVVAGHKKPDADDEAKRIIDQTREYIRDFAAIAGSAASMEEIVASMRSRYPDFGNLTTLHYSANAAFRSRTIVAAD